MADEPKRRSCGTMPVHERLLRTNPEYARARTESENRFFEYRIGRRAPARAGVTVIPVVVHVVWNAGHPEQNISDAQIQSQIDVLNKDFRKLNPDVASTPAPFLPLTADARIEFVLADKDPAGNPASGITRTMTATASFADDDSVKSAATGGADAWPADKYLNIWVCLLSGGLLGYAQFPGGPAATDGVVILHSAFGTTGTAAAPFDKGRTTTHEIGHWVNLRHIWGDDGTGCSGSDFVDDTPNQGGPNYGTPAFPHVTCSNGPNGDMFMNYMDYVDDVAMFMFSAGQVVRMQATLDGDRSSIGTTKPVVTLPAVDVITLKFRDDPITLKFRDDPITFKFRDDPITLKFRDDPITLKFRDDPITLKFRDDPITFKFRDDPITLKFRDDLGTLKFREDVATTPAVDIGKPPAADLPGGGLPGLPPEMPAGRGGAVPFILSTGHHSMAWTGSYPEAAPSSAAEIEQLLPQYEQAIEEINQAQEQGLLTQEDMEYAERIEAEYQQLLTEYKRLAAGGA